jgi:HEAT repeat protein
VPGLDTTFELLTTCRNEAADAVLVPALDHPSPPLRHAALRAVLERACLPGQKWAVENLHKLGESGRSIIRDYRGTMTFALRDAVLATDQQTCKNGCELTLLFHEYELFPALINASEDETSPNRALTAHTLLQLAEHLYDELAAPRNPNARRNPDRVRENVVAALELSVQRFHRHRVAAVMEAFLMLASRDNPTLQQILADPRNVNYLPLADMLTHSPRVGIVRLVLSFLDDLQAPSAAMTLLAYRHDAPFIEALLRKVGADPAPVIATNLRRLENISWLQSEDILLARLDDAAQRAAVQFAVRSGVNRRAVFKLLETVLERGKPAGRIAAADALAQFNGAEANALAMRALLDSDPQVQAKVLVQLRNRGIPGAVSKLIELLESPHAAVRAAARESLAEFSFQRFVAAYDLLDEDVRRSTGDMVAKVDPTALTALTDELRSQSRSRRLRAISMALTMDVVTKVEQALHGALLDEDHLVRAEAARALAHCDTPETHIALREALSDRSLVVREAAEASLQTLNQPVVAIVPLPPPPPWQQEAAS